jgi:hypothetical protein
LQQFQAENVVQQTAQQLGRGLQQLRAERVGEPVCRGGAGHGVMKKSWQICEAAG